MTPPPALDQPQTRQYGATAKSFHWLVVILVAIQFALGWLMPNIKRGMQPEGLMSLHLSFGFIILLAMLLRGAWRLRTGVPPPEPGLPRWQVFAADALHLLLYGLIFLMIFTGWSFASVRGWTILVFGILPVPPIFAQGSALGNTIGQLHGTLSWFVLGAIGLHALAGLAHWLFWRDRVMQRMWPRFKSGTR